MTREVPTQNNLPEKARLLGARAGILHQEYSIARKLRDKQDALRKKYAEQFKKAEEKMDPWEPWKIQAKEFMPPSDVQKYEKWEAGIREHTKEIYTLLEDALTLLAENEGAEWSMHMPKKDTKDSQEREYSLPLDGTYQIKLGWHFMTPDAIPLDRPEHNMEGYIFEIQGHRNVRKGLIKIRSEKDHFPWIFFAIDADKDEKFIPHGSWQMHYDTAAQGRISGLLLKLGSELRKNIK